MTTFERFVLILLYLIAKRLAFNFEAPTLQEKEAFKVINQFIMEKNENDLR